MLFRSELLTIAPKVVAVSGNCDLGDDAWGLVHVARTTIATTRFLLIHELQDLGPRPDDVDVVVFGHTHRPETRFEDGVWYLNPGSASQRRRMPSRSVCVVDIEDDGSVLPRIVMLDDDPGPSRERIDK